FTAPPTTEIYTLSLHDALPISGPDGLYRFNNLPVGTYDVSVTASGFATSGLKNVAVELNKTATANVTMQVQGVTQEVAVVEAPRSEEHTSELQSRGHLVCRLLL